MEFQPRYLYLSNAVISIAGFVLLYAFGNSQHAMSFGLGSGLVVLNWIVLSISWGSLLGKKSIALGIPIIVIKWAIFGAIGIIAVRQPWVNPFWLALGISTIIPAILVMGFTSREEKR